MALSNRNAVVDEENQRREFGGINWGAAFFGWLVAAGMLSILTALLSAAGGAVVLTKSASLNNQNLPTVGLASGIFLLIISGVAYYAGGYVAGRMSRFDGARQGIGVWLIGLILTVLLGIVGYIFGAKYNVFQQLNLPHVPISQGTYSSAGLISLILLVIVTLLAAIIGGRTGLSYHSRVDRAGTDVRAGAAIDQHAFGERVDKERRR